MIRFTYMRNRERITSEILKVLYSECMKCVTKIAGADAMALCI